MRLNSTPLNLNAVITICTVFSVSSISISSKLNLGFDFGTSGVRCCVIDENKAVIHEDSLIWNNILNGNAASSTSWSFALHDLIQKIPRPICTNIFRISVSGTSSSVLLYDIINDKVSREPRMYNYNILQQSDSEMGKSIMKLIQSHCPKGSATDASTSTLAKFLLWHKETPIQPHERLVHQSEFLSNQLISKPSIKNRIFTSDWHNALKLGYDIHSLSYPNWLIQFLRLQHIPSPDTVLPQIIQPGVEIESIRDDFVDKFGFPPSCVVVGGTTDSIAAFLASGARHAGQAVTSLGSTLAVKLLSERAVDDSERGIYSHRLGNEWLVGGASNVGCLILRHLSFSPQELLSLSNEINPSLPSSLLYYPLVTTGERFPVNNPNKQPVLEPVPESRREFLHGILQGISEVEREGYKALVELGATPPIEILTCGGGAQNNMWMKMRERMLGVPVRRAENVDAAFGAACLALKYTSQ